MPDRNYYMIRAMLSREDDFKIFLITMLLLLDGAKLTLLRFLIPKK